MNASQPTIRKNAQWRAWEPSAFAVYWVSVRETVLGVILVLRALPKWTSIRPSNSGLKPKTWGHVQRDFCWRGQWDDGVFEDIFKRIWTFLRRRCHLTIYFLPSCMISYKFSESLCVGESLLQAIRHKLPLFGRACTSPSNHHNPTSAWFNAVLTLGELSLVSHRSSDFGLLLWWWSSTGLRPQCSYKLKVKHQR